MEGAGCLISSFRLGRVIAAAAKLLALHPREGEDFYAVMWLSATRKPSTEPTMRRTEPGSGEAAA